MSAPVEAPTSAPVEDARDAPLPDLFVEVLDQATVDQLLFDIGAAARLHGVLVKGAAEGHAQGAAPDLTLARRALADGLGIQLRYQHQGAEWWDTLLPLPDRRVRLVRVRQA